MKGSQVSTGYIDSTNNKMTILTQAYTDWPTDTFYDGYFSGTNPYYAG